MDRTGFDKLINSLSAEQQNALSSNPDAVREFASRLAATAGSIFTHQLDFTGGPGLIRRLLEKGGPWGQVSPAINDDNYPVTGEGIVTVRFRVISGVEFSGTGDSYVYRSDLEAHFRTERMRCPNAAETLLVLAEDHQIGRGDHPLIALIKDSDDAFFVCQRNGGCNLYRDSGTSVWCLNYVFLGVCE